MLIGWLTSAFFPLSGFALDNFPFPLFEFFGGGIVNYLGAVEATVGPTGRQGNFTFVGAIRFRVGLGCEWALAAQEPINKVWPEGGERRLVVVRELRQVLRVDEIVILVNSTE
jgi:hypothetical protein